ncbi:MAG: hypothetical protein JW881_16980 [Spirochaetales bacterium]|nr:hypothetical protein [Spirochaetales bacterium]
MKIKINRLYIAIPLVYVCFILLFLLFHILNEKAFENEPVGYLVISGSRVEGNLFRKRGISRLNADVGGFRLSISDAKPLVLIQNDGRKRSFHAESCTVFEKSVEVKFEEGLSLILRVGGDIGERVSVYPGSLFQSGEIRELVIPYEITGSRPETSVSVPVLSCMKAANLFYLSLPSGSSIDTAKKNLIVRPPAERTTPAVIIEKSDDTRANPYLYWFDEYAGLPDRREYEAIRDAWIDTSYEGFRSGRYDREQGRWRTGGGDEVFDERIACAILSEALVRGDGVRRARSVVSDAVEKESERSPEEVFSLMTVPYLGGLGEAAEAFKRLDAVKLDEVERSMQEKDPSVFTMPDLVLFLLNRTNMYQFNNLIRLVQYVGENADFDSLDTAVCLGMMEAFYDVARFLPGSKDYFSPFRRIPDAGIFPRLVPLERGVFLEERERTGDTPRIDLLRSVRCGFSCIAAGVYENDQRLVSLGRKLILSALSFGGEYGFLPAEIRLHPDNGAEVSGVCTPESVYEYIADAPFIPRQIPLDPEIRPGTWIWTVARVERYVKTDAEVRLVLSFPSGEHHFFFIQGLGNVGSCVLHEREHEADGDYERRMYGWFYDEQSETLYVKLNHLQDEEEIRILFGTAE